MTAAASTIAPPIATPATRWIQLGLGLICMMAISSPQYVWTLFTKPMASTFGVAPASLQVTFSLLIVLQTFFSPFQGSLAAKGLQKVYAAAPKRRYFGYFCEQTRKQLTRG